MIVEAVGESYNVPGVVAELESDVRTLYQNSDPGVARSLIEKLGADYFYIGDYEHSLYGPTSEEKFEQLGKLVFQGSRAKLYELRSR